ncbi:MAG: dihydropteroate synthase [Epsilonproteobacteria bacterium]|nr:dihydropteroate synthase [Campylobacterota bacterium]
MKLYKIANVEDKTSLLKSLGVQSGGVNIMASKMQTHLFMIKNLPTPAVNILKQDALSIGAELAIPSGVIICEKSHYDCLLIATSKHLEILSRKELVQHFGLKNVAIELKKFLKQTSYKSKIMGILNANDDSFYASSRFSPKNATQKINEMIKEGADIIDIGAVSSRPNAPIVSQREEMSRLKDILDTIKEQKLFEKALFSIDSYTPKVVEYALKSGFSIINDITGASDDELIKLAMNYNAKICIMHMKGTPQTMQNAPTYDDVMVEVSDFFEERILKCESFGLKREDIILDVGIGFGKSLEHNITLIKNMAHFRKFGCEILAGASRKSMIDKIVSSKIEERLAGSLAIHLKALEHGASILRCHDVYEHYQAVKVWEAMR